VRTIFQVMPSKTRQRFLVRVVFRGLDSKFSCKLARNNDKADPVQVEQVGAPTVPSAFITRSWEVGHSCHIAVP
jgi:hypothetical protein